jgi:hypothetical protein
MVNATVVIFMGMPMQATDKWRLTQDSGIKLM